MNYYNIDNAIARIRELYNFFKDWGPISKFYPDIKQAKKFKKSLRIAMVSTISASLELAKQGEINIRQDIEFGEIFLKKVKKNG